LSRFFNSEKHVQEGAMKRKIEVWAMIAIGSGLILGGLAKDADGEDVYAKQATISESGGKIHVAANDSRPLLQALEALQQRYGWRIDYEDPQYIAKPDFQDQPASETSSGRRVPDGGAFAADFPAGSAPDSPPDEQKALQLVVDAYNQSSNPGRFEIRQYGERFIVVGISARDMGGKISPSRPLLDSKITLRAEERTVIDTFDLICKKISDLGTVKVSSGIIPFGLDRSRITVGGTEADARSYVEDLIKATGRKMCWRLLFDPESKSYIINFHQVKSPATKPAVNPAKP
jgi:hypothetical protein